MATTRLGLNGYGTRPAGSFAGRAPGGHPVGVITRLTLNGYAGKRAGDFSGRVAAGGHPVGTITRLGLNGFMVERVGSFADKAVSPVVPEAPEGTAGGRARPFALPFREVRKERKEEEALLAAKEERLREVLAEIKSKAGFLRRISHPLLQQELALRVQIKVLEEKVKELMEQERLAQMRDDEEALFVILMAITDD